MRIVGILALSFFLVAGTFACNREEPPPPEGTSAPLSNDAKTTSPSTQQSFAECIKAARASTDRKNTSPKIDTSAAESSLWIAHFSRHRLTPKTMYQEGQLSTPWPSPKLISREEELQAWFNKSARRDKGEDVDLFRDRRALKDIPLKWFGGNVVPETWYGISLQENSAGEPVTVHVAEALEEFSVTYEGFTWNLAVDRITPSGDHHGIAFSQQLASVAPAVQMDKESPERDQIVNFLRPVFDREEDEGLQRILPDKNLHPLVLTERIKEPLNSKIVKFAFGDNGHYYFFDMWRKYPVVKKSTGGLTQLVGWVMDSGGKNFCVLGRDLVLEDTDAVGVIRAEPQYMLQWDGRTFANMEWSRYDASDPPSYEIMDLGGNGWRLRSK